MRAILLLFLAVLSYGCGGGGNGSTLAPQPPLQGFWGGYFPGSSLENPRAGVEVHFERHGRNGFIHRESDTIGTGTAHRAPVTVEQVGNDVTLTFEGGNGDVSIFAGRFVDEHRLRGRFTNESRGEDFPLELVRAESLGLEPPTPPEETEGTPAVAGALEAPLGSGPIRRHLTLQIQATTVEGKTYTFLTGLGYYFNPGTWSSQDDIPGSPTSNPATGPSAVLQLLFFPSWIVFDLYAYHSQIPISASLEVPLTSFAQANRTTSVTVVPDDCSFVGLWPNDDTARSVTMQYVETDAFYDRIGWSTDFDSDADDIRIEYDGVAYTVPFNAGSMLLGFDGVALLTEAPAAKVVEEEAAAGN